MPRCATRRVAGDHPYLSLRKRGRAFEAAGQPVAAFGHRLPTVGHAVDDGVFAEWHWDGVRLVVNNDRYGIFPLFWYRSPDGGVCVSSSLATLIELGAPTQLDLEALAVFLRLGIFVGDDTPFAAIKVIPPNAAFEWHDGVLACTGRYPETPVVSAISRDDAIDRYIALFARAMAKRRPVSGNFAMPISGGRDSRHILLELHRTGFKPEVCVSAWDNPPDPNRDPIIGKELCGALGLQHATVDQRLSLLDAELRKNRETHFCASTHGWYLALADYLNGHFDAAYDGIAGDVWSQSAFLDADLDAAFRLLDESSIAAALLDAVGTPEATLGATLGSGLRGSRNRNVAINRLAREIEKHLGMPNPIASFFFWNRTRRMTALAPYALLRGVPTAYAPFLDHDLFDFMTTLPTAMLMDRRFHDDAIARAYPRYAHIPYADNKRDPATDATTVKSRFLSQAVRRYLLHKPWSLLRNIGPRMRILAGAVSQGKIMDWQLPMVVYLDQLEGLMKSQHVRPG